MKRDVDTLREDVYLSLTLLNRSSSLIRRMSGDENVDAFISKVQRLIFLINQARLAWHAYQIAQAGAGPAGWAMAAIGAVGFTLTAAEMATDLGA